MATLSIDIADADYNRVVTALCKSTSQDVTEANAKKAVIDYISRITVSYEAAIEQVNAMAAATQAARQASPADDQPAADPNAPSIQ